MDAVEKIKSIIAGEMIENAKKSEGRSTEKTKEYVVNCINPEDAYVVDLHITDVESGEKKVGSIYFGEIKRIRIQEEDEQTAVEIDKDDDRVKIYCNKIYTIIKKDGTEISTNIQIDERDETKTDPTDGIFKIDCIYVEGKEEIEVGATEIETNEYIVFVIRNPYEVIKITSVRGHEIAIGDVIHL